MGANNHEAGRLSGSAMGKYAKDTWDCDYTAYVSLESAASGQANTDRMGGFRDGFKEYCDIPADKERILDGADRTDPALEAVSNLLPALPGNRIVVVAINEDGILGALGAARTLGREADVFVAGQGADPSAWKDIACNPQYIATVAYYPERYGRTVVPAMIDILDGKTVEGPLFTAHEVVNKDNIRTIYPETPAC
jgi:ribose transport system substrate-binding protein